PRAPRQGRARRRGADPVRQRARGAARAARRARRHRGRARPRARPARGGRGRLRRPSAQDGAHARPRRAGAPRALGQRQRGAQPHERRDPRVRGDSQVARGGETRMKAKLVIVLGFLVAAGVLVFLGIRKKGGDGEAPPGGTTTTPKTPADAVEITFLYSTEKKDWIEAATVEFGKVHPEVKVNLVGKGPI